MAHHVLHIQHDQRVPVLVDLTSAPGRTVVFTRTKHRAKSLARQLNQNGVPTVDLHGNLSQGARTRNMELFHSGTATTLVATDVAARGIHVDDVALVVHADPPSEHKAYLHRSGRTARAGAEGTVITLMTDDQVREVRTLTRAAGVKATTTRVAGLGDEVLRRLAPGQRTLVAGGLKPSPDATPSNPAPAGPFRLGSPASLRWRQRWVRRRQRRRLRSSWCGSRSRSQPGGHPLGREVAAAQRRVVQLAGSLTTSTRSGRPHVHHVRVGRGVGEAQALVEPDGRHVVGLDVEQHLVDAAVAEVAQARRRRAPCRGRGPARPGRCRRRTPRRASPSAAWSSGSRAAGPRRSATSSPAGSNHGSAIRSARLVGVHRALLGVVGEGRGVDPQHLRLVPGAERRAR